MRHKALPRAGRALVSTDVHGNGGDFRRLEALFRAAHADDPATYWVILGDVVHAPDDRSAASQPELYGYADESAFIVERILALRAEHPERVLFVLGNHDYAHIGGPRTAKFFPDEAANLEGKMGAPAIAAMHALFRDALLCVSTGCGVVMTHGSPDATLQALDDLDAIALPHDRGNAYHHGILASMLHAYGQRGPVTAQLLAQLSRGLPPESAPLAVLVHGHDRHEHGFFVEGGNQLCPVIFGAYAHEKRYLLLDLAATYARPEDLRDGHEMRRLHA
jgi:predicted phosphodiesterase